MLRSRSRFFCWSATAVSFWQAKKESLVLVSNMTKEQFIKVKYDPKRLALIINLLRAENNKFKCMEPEPRPPFFCLELEQALFGRSRSRLRDFGHPEPEPPKKVAAPQHWLIQYRNCQRQIQFCVIAALSTFENNLKIAYIFFSRNNSIWAL